MSEAFSPAMSDERSGESNAIERAGYDVAA